MDCPAVTVFSASVVVTTEVVTSTINARPKLEARSWQLNGEYANDGYWAGLKAWDDEIVARQGTEQSPSATGGGDSDTGSPTSQPPDTQTGSATPDPVETTSGPTQQSTETSTPTLTIESSSQPESTEISSTRDPPSSSQQPESSSREQTSESRTSEIQTSETQTSQEQTSTQRETESSTAIVSSRTISGNVVVFTLTRSITQTVPIVTTPPCSSSGTYTSVLITTSITLPNGQVSAYSTLVPSLVSDPNANSADKLATGTIVGISIAAIVACILLGGIGLLFVRRRKKQREMSWIQSLMPQSRRMLDDDDDDHTFSQQQSVQVSVQPQSYQYGVVGRVTPHSHSNSNSNSHTKSMSDVTTLQFGSTGPLSPNSVPNSGPYSGHIPRSSHSGSIFREEFDDSRPQSTSRQQSYDSSSHSPVLPQAQQLLLANPSSPTMTHSDRLPDQPPMIPQPMIYPPQQQKVAPLLNYAPPSPTSSGPPPSSYHYQKASDMRYVGGATSPNQPPPQAAKPQPQKRQSTNLPRRGSVSQPLPPGAILPPGPSTMLYDPHDPFAAPAPAYTPYASSPGTSRPMPAPPGAQAPRIPAFNDFNSSSGMADMIQMVAVQTPTHTSHELGDKKKPL